MKVFGYLFAIFAAIALWAGFAGDPWQFFFSAANATMSAVCFYSDRRDKQREADEARRRAQRYE